PPARGAAGAGRAVREALEREGEAAADRAAALPQLDDLGVGQPDPRRHRRAASGNARPAAHLVPATGRDAPADPSTHAAPDAEADAQADRATTGAHGAAHRGADPGTPAGPHARPLDPVVVVLLVEPGEGLLVRLSFDGEPRQALEVALARGARCEVDEHRR